ncbi:MAG: hypothetical protein WC649_12395 [Desulfobacteria bacterium]
MDNTEEIIKALPLVSKHKLALYQKRLEWIRVTITILTPSLVLLIGLQGKPQPSEILLRFLLLTSVLLMTLSILTGLWVLLGESTAHYQAVADIKQWVDSGNRVDDLPHSVEFPWHQKILIRIFPIFVWLSILFLGAFGILKYL